MKKFKLLSRFILPLTLLLTISPYTTARTLLKLDGYADETGAISTLHKGVTIDPYFTLQALLLAHENDLDITPCAAKWLNWLIERQKLDGTFDRYCRSGPVWVPCKTADADDALLAIWLNYLEIMPTELKMKPAFIKSHNASKITLDRLLDPVRHIYLVSPIYQHGLFMDNLEVWSYKKNHAESFNKNEYNQFTKAISKVFYDSPNHHFLVSTQPEQKTAVPAFYPDYVAQIFPLLFNYPILPTKPDIYYQQWMHQYRSLWLHQVKDDFAWGLISILAWQHHDSLSARCWLRETLPYRHSSHWTVTDEVAYQILTQHGLKPINSKASCK